MLDRLRKFAKSKGALLLIGLLILSFGLFWGISDMMSERHDGQKLATVGKEHVDVASFQQALKHELEHRGAEITKRTGKPFDMQALKEQAMAQGLGQMLVHQLATRLAYTQEARRIGIEPSEAQVKAMIQNLPVFKDENGNFSKQQFQGALQQAGMSEPALVKGFKDDISQSYLLGALTSLVTASQEVAKAFYTYEKGRRLVSWTILTTKGISEQDLPPVKEEELKAYYEKNKSHFAVPEYRHLQVIEISLEKLKTKHTATPEEVHAEFERRKREFETPETRKLTHILTQDAAIAEKASALLAKNTKVGELPKRLGEKTLQVEHGSWIDKAHLPKKVAEAVFALKKGVPSQPVKTSNGTYIFIVEDIKPAKAPEFNTVSAKIKAELLTNKAKEELYEQVKKVEDEISGGATFAEVAKTHDLLLKSYPKVDAQGGFDTKLPPAQPHHGEDYGAIIKAGFETGEGLESNTLELHNGNMAIVRVEAVTPPSTLAFEQAKPGVTQLWQFEKRINVISDTAKAAQEGKLTEAQSHLMKQNLLPEPLIVHRDGHMGFSKSAVSGALNSAQLDNILKGGKALPAAAIDAVFKATPGEKIVAHIPYMDEERGRPALAVLMGTVKEALPVDLSDFEKNKEAYTNALAQAFASDVQAFYTLALHAGFKTKINPALGTPTAAREEE